MPERHSIYYYDPDDDGRQAWACATCGLGGSVGEFGDPELAAERAHERRGVTTLGRTSREPL